MTTPNVIQNHLELAVREEVRAIAQRLSKLDSIHRFSFEIEASGRPDGEIKVEFKLGVNYEGAVSGNALEPVIREALRRKGWNEANAPLMLTHDAERLENEKAP